MLSIERGEKEREESERKRERERERERAIWLFKNYVLSRGNTDNIT